MESASGPVLEVDGVSKSFNGRPAVRDVSFAVERGMICGFLGPNGAGKTTTLRMILDVIRPDAGAVRLFGRPPTKRARDKVGFLPEERGLYRKMTPLSVITFFGRMKGMGAGEARRKARALLEEYGLGEVAEKKIKTLSKGMAQKVQILGSVAHDPEFVILDEPFSGLDPVNQQTLENLVLGLREQGATVLFSTHVMEHAERLCDRIVLIAQGRKIFDGRVDEALAEAPRQVILETEAGIDLPGRLSLAGVRFTPEEASEPDNARWRADLDNGAGAQDLLRACVESGAPLRLFEPVRPHLHDAFMTMVSAASSRPEEAA